MDTCKSGNEDLKDMDGYFLERCRVLEFYGGFDKTQSAMT